MPATADAQALAGELTGLAPDTVYRYRVVATNALGTTTSDATTFTTPSGPQAPVALTGLAGDVTTDGATLGGAVDPRGRPTAVTFELGRDDAYGAVVGGATLDAGPATVTARVPGLTPGTTYHYRVVAESDAGRSAGADRTFTTDPVPAPATPAPTSPGPLPGAGPGLLPSAPADAAPQPGRGHRTADRDPRLRLTVARRVRGARATVTVRTAPGADGRVRVTARRSGPAARVARVAARDGRATYRLSRLRRAGTACW